MEVPDKYYKELIVKIQSLTFEQDLLLNKLIEKKLRKLSLRTYHALIEYLNNNITITNFNERIFSHKNFSYYDIKNVGVKSVKELTGFQTELLKLTALISVHKSEQELYYEYFLLYLKEYYNIQSNHFAEISSFFNKTEKILLFKTLQILLDNDYIFVSKKKTIFKYYFNNNTKKTKDLAEFVNLTRTRIGQLRKQLYGKFSDYFEILKHIDKKQIYFYDIDLNQTYITIDNILVEKINKKENVNFNLLFISNVLSVLSENTHSYIGKEKQKGLYNNGIKYEWKKKYLIVIKLTNIFDFTQFVDDIAKRLSERINKTYWLDFKQYILLYYKSKKITNINVISEICKKILFSEFMLIIDSKNIILFEKNTYKKLPEYIEELLERERRPMNIYEMLDILNKQYPKLFKSVNSIRSICQRVNNIIYFGRTSTYAFKELEKTDINIKGGTIRSIVEEYLLQFDEPKHISEIAKYVIRFRPNTNTRSIIQNLKLDKSKRFVLFKNSHIGLNCKMNYYNNILNFPRHIRKEFLK